MKKDVKCSQVMSAFKKQIIPAQKIKKYKEYILSANLNSVNIVCRVGLVISAVLLFLSLPYVNVLHLLPAYASLTAVFAAVTVLLNTVLTRHRQWVLSLYYLLMILLFGCAIAMGTVMGKTTNATTYLIFMLALPLFVIDRPVRINSMLFGFTLLFCVAALVYKSGEILLLDISNALIICLISMALVSVNANRKIHDFEVMDKEKSLVSEKDNIINAIPTGIAVYEIRNGVTQQTFINDGFFRLLEDTREQRLKRSNGSFMYNIHPDDRKAVADSIESVKNGEEYVSLNCRAIKGDGTYKWLMFSAAVAQRTEELVLVYVTYVSIEEEVKSRIVVEESRAVLEAAISSTSMTVWELDCVHNRIIQNEKSMEKHGYEKIINNVPESLIDSGYFKKSSVMPYRRMYQQLMDTHKTVQGDFCVRINGKEGYWWEHIILTPVFDSTGKMTKAIGTSIDVSERKNREEQFYRQIGLMSDNGDDNLIAKAQYNLSRHRLVSFSALSDDAVVIDADDDFNSIINKITSVQTDEESRQQTRELINYSRLMQEYTDGRTEGSIQYKRKAKGKPFNYAMLKYLISAEPQTNDVYVFIYCYDNTHNIVEQSIVKQLASEKYESIGIIDVETQDYVLEQAGGSFFSCLSKAGHNYYEKCCPAIMSAVMPEQREEMLKKTKLENVISQLENKSVYEFGYTMLNGEKKFRRKKLSFQYIDDSKKTILCSCSDITELYQQEQEQMIRLQEALAEAKQATQAKTEFLSRMSHDIRTPLNAILGITALAKDETDNPNAINEYLSTIDSSGHFLLGLINDILDINKIESGKIELKPEVCSVSEYASDIKASIQPLMESKHIDFTLDMGCGNKYIMVDRIRHHQVFFNLLSNAAKYTPDYGRVEYITKSIDAPEGKTGIRNIIRDNGIGMNKEYLDSLFEPFTRDTNAVINQTEGSGLGLAIVKNIVDAMGGKITVESTLGKGTEFVVDLFLDKVPDGYTFEERVASTENKGIDGCKILLVEDNEINTRIAKKLLEKKQCVVTTVTNGREAVDYVSAAEENSIDVILMDIRMPVMNGLDATKAIRSLDRKDAESIPIIAMTADAFSDDIIRTQQVGMNGHIPKPVEPEKLYEMIAQMISA